MWCDETGEQRTFCPEDGLRRRMKFQSGLTLVLAQAQGRHKFRDLGGRKNLAEVWLTNILFQLVSGDKTVQLIIYKTKNGNLECLCLK